MEIEKVLELIKENEIKINERFNKMGAAFMELKAVPGKRYFVRPHCSEETNEIDAAHALALTELRNVPKSAQANRSTYAKVEHCTEYLNPVLSKFGLSIKQIPFYNEFNEDILITRFSHKSGQWYESCSVLKIEKTNQSPSQLFGSSITYMRRYALLAILGIGQTDDPTDIDR